MSVRYDVAVVVPDGGQLPEGPTVVGDVLSWVDMPAGELHRIDLATGERTSRVVADLLSAAVPRLGGGYVVAADQGFGHLTVDGLTDYTPAVPSRTLRMNDAKADSRGRVWAGSAAWSFEPGQGALHSWAGDGPPARLDSGLTLPNGLGWSGDGARLLLVDSVERVLLAYDCDPDTGRVSGRRVAAHLDDVPGLPDGLAMDVEDCAWVAFYGGGRVCRVAPDGRRVAEIELPVTQVTSCAFGAGDALYVTTARQDCQPAELAAQPLAGAIFRIEVGVAGHPFAPAA